jgi:hypothetical protein
MMLGGLFVMVGSGLMMLGFVQSAHFLLPREAAGSRGRTLPGQDANAVTFA